MTHNNRLIIFKYILLVIIANTSIACTTAVSPDRPEPNLVAVLNNSNTNIEIVRIGTIADGRKSGSRFGSISPLPVGITQMVVRPTSRVRLPNKLQISWVDVNGRSKSYVVPIDKVINKSTGRTNEALLFVIQHDGRVYPTLKIIKPR